VVGIDSAGGGPQHAFLAISDISFVTMDPAGSIAAIATGIADSGLVLASTGQP
jgi:hypothetical protein